MTEMRVGAIILAAGGSSRMGSPKQLLPYRGRPLIQHVVEQALASKCDRVFVVLGANAEAIADTLKTSLPSIVQPLTEPRPLMRFQILRQGSEFVTLCINPRWQEGMGTSIRAGVEAAVTNRLDAVIIALGDQPLISSQILNTLIATYLETRKPLVASRYADVAGVPALFARELFPELLELPPGSGCKALIESQGDQSAIIDCPEAEMDIDTPDDYARTVVK